MIRKYWSDLADDLRQNPMKFYKTFKPFLDRKDKGDGVRDIHLNMEHQCKWREKTWSPLTRVNL